MDSSLHADFFEDVASTGFGFSAVVIGEKTFSLPLPNSQQSVDR